MENKILCPSTLETAAWSDHTLKLGSGKCGPDRELPGPLPTSLQSLMGAVCSVCLAFGFVFVFKGNNPNSMS